MSSSRSKYTSTPTYGMQKRGSAKKQTEKATNKEPDFTQQPMADLDVQNPVFTDPFATPQGLYHETMPPQGAFYPPVPPSQNMGGQGNFYMQGMGGQGGYPLPEMGLDDRIRNLDQSMATPQQTMMPPLANATQFNSEPGMPGRAQGYVPPKVISADQMSSQPMQTPPMQAAQPQQAPSMQVPQSPMMQYSQAPQMPLQTGVPEQFAQQIPQQQNMTPPMQYPQSQSPFGQIADYTQQTSQYPQANYQNQGYQGQDGNAYQSFSGGSLPPMPPPEQPLKKAPKQPINVDNWLKMLFFIILPVIFVLCIALPTEFDIVRYLYMTTCAATTGVMWYRQSFTSSLRAGITMGYALMCIVVVVMLMGANSDSVQSQSSITAQPTPTMTEEPTSESMGYAADEAPVETEEVEVSAAESEAGQRLSTFMDIWMENDIESMLNYVLPSWRQEQSDPATELFVIISNRTPLEYEIESVSGDSSDTSRSVTMTASIDKNDGDDAVTYRFIILMDYEDGDWYVDPNSLSTNDVEDEDTDATEVPEDLEAIFTLVPRTTVTPVPPDDTLLYYNADGGSYYHADPECSAVNEKYFPLASFTYGELDEEPYSDLTPCLVCNAPTE